MLQTDNADSAARMQQCIDACRRCHEVCLSAIGHCLEMGGEHVDSGHIRLLMDCAQICVTSADFMLRRSSLHHLTCATCATVCDACAADCATMADDPVMQNCADVCRQCAQSCQTMANG